MAEAFAKFRVGTPGDGSSHASYITRAAALEPDKQRNRDGESGPNRDESSVVGTLDDHLNDSALTRHSAEDADPVWTRNAPMFLTGDDHGSHEVKSTRGHRDVTERDRFTDRKDDGPDHLPQCSQKTQREGS